MDFWGAQQPRNLAYQNGEKYIPGGWIVQKFGGTSIGKFANNIAQNIVKPNRASNRIAIVCSARSNSTKSEGTTNRLLRAAREAKIKGSRHYYAIVDAIREDHLQAAREVIEGPELLSQLVADIKTECENLVRILESAQYLEEVSPRVQDKIVSKGEKLSCLFMTALLQDRGVEARYVDLSDVLDAGAPPVQRLGEAFYEDLAKSMASVIYDGSDAVPVCTGYFGNIPDERSVPGGTMKTIGRGYTDLCAALVAIGLKAKELQIWKEVDGIFTADPNKVPTARLLAQVSPSEAAELTFYGSEVVHPFTMEQAVRHLIPIRIKNVMNPDNPGTEIRPDGVGRPLKEDVTTLFTLRGPKRPTAVTVKRSICILNVHSNKKTRRHGFLMEIASILDKHHLSVDLISSSEVHISLALHSESVMLSGGGRAELEIQSEDLRKAVADLADYGTIDLVPNMAIVSLVGRQLKKMVGIAGKLFTVLGQNNINIEMISQGASEINISCVIDEHAADRALNVIHTNLFTFLD